MILSVDHNYELLILKYFVILLQIYEWEITKKIAVTFPNSPTFLLVLAKVQSEC